MHPRPRSTPAGEHRPVLLDAVLRLLDPQPGQIAADCTTGWAGHSAEILQRLGPAGLLVALDLDADNLPKARERLESVGHPFQLRQANFAGLAQVVGELGVVGVDLVLADLGMSSMQVDDPSRGFSYVRQGPLDMRMDRARGRTAAQLLNALPENEIAEALREFGDEPNADLIARAIVQARGARPLEKTSDLAQLILQTTKQENWRLQPSPGKWAPHPAGRTFQALRILVNRELNNLCSLLRVLPEILKPGGRAGIISFHSGEDRLVKAAFKEGLRSGVYDAISEDPIRPGFAEKQANPRSRSAKLRWTRRSLAG